MLGVVCTGLAFAIFYELVATIGPGRAYTVTYIAPGFAGHAAILLSEEITVATVIGLALIVAGSYLAAGGVLRAGRRRGQETPSLRRTPFVESRTTDLRRVYA